MFILFLSLSVFSLSQLSAECKGKSQSDCESDSSCTWVNGYKKKTGSSVDSYCRNKPGKSGEKKSKTSKSDDDSDKGDKSKKSKKEKKSKKGKKGNKE